MEANVPTVSEEDVLRTSDRLLINKDGKVQQVSIKDLMDLFEAAGFQAGAVG